MSKILLLILLIATGCPSTSSSQHVKAYPLSICIVTDNKLGSMGTPVSVTYNGQKVMFCCKPCVPKFYEDPEKYLAKIR